MIWDAETLPSNPVRQVLVKKQLATMVLVYHLYSPAAKTTKAH